MHDCVRVCVTACVCVCVVAWVIGVLVHACARANNCSYSCHAVVQRGTNHGWYVKPGDEPCMMVAVLIDSAVGGPNKTAAEYVASKVALDVKVILSLSDPTLYISQ